jgi:menaquinone-dependent protoporphyrinogen IX oxidase
MPLADVGDGSKSNIDSFDAVIIGAPINGMRWVEEAKNFVERNAGIMQSKKVVLFYVSYLLDNGYGIWQKSIHGSLKKLVPLVKPVAIGEFKGRVDKPFTGFIRFLFGSRKDEPIDRTDWDHVDDFADNLDKLL